MTIHRSTPFPHTQSMVITPPRRNECKYDTTTVHSLNSMAVLSLNDRSSTKFRLLPRRDSIRHQRHHYQNLKRPLVHIIHTDDASIQSPTAHRKYMRRGSRTPSMLMLCHTALLEMAQSIDTTTESTVTTPTSSSSTSLFSVSTPIKNNEAYDNEMSHEDEPNPNVMCDNINNENNINNNNHSISPTMDVFSDDMYRNSILLPKMNLYPARNGSVASVQPHSQHLPSIPLL